MIGAVFRGPRPQTTATAHWCCIRTRAKYHKISATEHNKVEVRLVLARARLETKESVDKTRVKRAVGSEHK